MKFYCTTFCNQAHDLADGKPVGHECYILRPDLLAKEHAGESVTEAMPKEPRRVHAGKKARQ